MAHNLMQNTMAFVGETPWHGLGKRVDPDATSAEMIKAANLDWQVTKAPATGALRRKDRHGKEIFDRYFLIRDKRLGETEAPVLGIVSHGYEVLQNDEAFAFFEPLLKAGGARYEAAGALGNGERVWVQVRLKDPFEVVPGDEVERFILLSNSHDGKGALSLRFTPVRVVCQNTLNLATKGGEHVVRVQHSRRMRERLADEQVTMLLTVIGETYKRAAEQFRRLAQEWAAKERKDAFLDTLFPRTKLQRESREVPKRWGVVDQVLADETVTPEATAGTMWGLYNAVTRAEDYRATTETSPSARLDRVWFGRGADLKIKALKTALELCGAE